MYQIMKPSTKNKLHMELNDHSFIREKLRETWYDGTWSNPFIDHIIKEIDLINWLIAGYPKTEGM